jgi:hypothetical protein
MGSGERHFAYDNENAAPRRAGISLAEAKSRSWDIVQSAMYLIHHS